MKFEQVKNNAKKFLAANELRSALETLQSAFLPNGLNLKKASRIDLQIILDDSWNFIAELMTKYTVNQDPKLHKDVLKFLNKLAMLYGRNGFAKESRNAYFNIANIEEDTADILTEQLKDLSSPALKQQSSEIVEYYKSSAEHYKPAGLSTIELCNKTYALNISIFQMQEDLLALQIKHKLYEEAFQTVDDMNDQYCATVYRDYQEMVTKTKALNAQYKECSAQQKKQFTNEELNFDPVILKRNAESMDYLVAGYRQLLPFAKDKPEILAKATYFAQQVYNIQAELTLLRNENIIQDDKDLELPGDCKKAVEFYHTQSAAPRADFVQMRVASASNTSARSIQNSAWDKDENIDMALDLEISDYPMVLFSEVSQKAGSAMDKPRDDKTERSERKSNKKHTPSYRDKKPY